MTYDNTNTGALFPNKNRKTENHPNLTGSINIEGVEHWLSAWTKVDKNNKKYISISLGAPKEARPPQNPVTPEPQNNVHNEFDNAGDYDQDGKHIPF